jgi:nucleoid-associated protein YgaU
MSTIAIPTTTPVRVRTAGRTARVRWDRVAVLLVAALAVMWLLGATAGSSEAEEVAAAPVVVVVQPGDTLWDLAREHGPVGTATLEYAALVEQVNDVRAGVLLPGTILELPQG